MAVAGAGAAVVAGSGAAELAGEGEVEAATAGSSSMGAVMAGTEAAGAGAAADGSADGSFELSRDAMRPLRRVGAAAAFGALVAFFGGMVRSCGDGGECNGYV